MNQDRMFGFSKPLSRQQLLLVSMCLYVDNKKKQPGQNLIQTAYRSYLFEIIMYKIA